MTCDTMIAAGLLDPGAATWGLKDLAWSGLGAEMTPIDELIGAGKGQITMDRVPAEPATPYAAADADMTLRLAQTLPAGARDGGLWSSSGPRDAAGAGPGRYGAGGIKLDVPICAVSAAMVSQLASWRERSCRSPASVQHQLDPATDRRAVRRAGAVPEGLSKTPYRRLFHRAEVLEELRGRPRSLS